jgi:hypothetical protein
MGQVAPDEVTNITAAIVGKIRIIPPPIYEMTYQAMEICTGIQGEFTHVWWHRADRIYDTIYEEREYLGLWFEDEEGKHHIVLSKEYALHITVLSHEILHDLFFGNFPKEAAIACIPNWQGLIDWPKSIPAPRTTHESRGS